ncbi:hypothetical protein EV127DRAFT_134207 [Xylaria flabelliformis]|nr:hypothetical protein EV127DRAFT_134207 [Xylaria flabelliformis]
MGIFVPPTRTYHLSILFRDRPEPLYPSVSTLSRQHPRPFFPSRPTPRQTPLPSWSSQYQRPSKRLSALSDTQHKFHRLCLHSSPRRLSLLALAPHPSALLYRRGVFDGYVSDSDSWVLLSTTLGTNTFSRGSSRGTLAPSSTMAAPDGCFISRRPYRDLVYLVYISFPGPSCYTIKPPVSYCLPFFLTFWLGFHFLILRRSFHHLLHSFDTSQRSLRQRIHFPTATSYLETYLSSPGENEKLLSSLSYLIFQSHSQKKGRLHLCR